MSAISVVVPAYNEEAFLPRLLDSLALAGERFGQGPAAVELIVADNASTDGTAALAGTAGARVVPVAKRSIAAARNGGAAVATSPIVCFVDADSQVHPGVFDAVAEAMGRLQVGMGATGLRFERSSLAIATLMAIGTPLIRAAGIDGGLVFMRRDDFIAVGGYDETLLAAEDVDLLMRVKRRCAKRGERFCRLKDVETTTSARKFDKHGEWHFLRMVGPMGWSFLFDRARYERTVRAYWYEDR